MSKKKVLLFLLCSSFLFADEAPLMKDVEGASKALGKILRKQLEESNLHLSFDAVAEGLKEGSSKEEQIKNQEILLTYQRALFEEKAKESLLQAEKFLENNQKNPHIVELIPSKVQYQVEKKGEGKAVEEFHSPLVKMRAKLLDGSIFYESNGEENLDFHSLLPSLKQAIIGMREKEKRIVYLHPDHGYVNPALAPSGQLLIFEIEMIQANHPVNNPPDITHKTVVR